MDRNNELVDKIIPVVLSGILYGVLPAFASAFKWLHIPVVQ
jgi:hypothetical protein